MAREPHAVESQQDDHPTVGSLRLCPRSILLGLRNFWNVMAAVMHEPFSHSEDGILCNLASGGSSLPVGDLSLRLTYSDLDDLLCAIRTGENC